eukprot:15347056-Ditylum_brightwellii.AAC.1
MRVKYDEDYDPSGENDSTRGQEPLLKEKISFDKNGMPRYYARTNHPKVLQEPYKFFWWDAIMILRKYWLAQNCTR